jgi:hypothetical protein
LHRSDESPKISVVNLGKIQPPLIERAIGMVIALPIHKHGAAFVHGTRRQHIPSQRLARAARELFSFPQIAREQFHFFEILGRHLLFLLFLHAAK